MPNNKTSKKQIVSKNAKRSTLLRSRAAPVAEPYLAPQPHLVSAAPQSRGACARYMGVDFVGQSSSQAAGATTGSMLQMTVTNSTAFPRLSAIADTFLRWKPRRLKYHFIGRSASTQAGVGAWASFVLDASTSTITVNTESIIKNAEGSLTLKGWESGVHVVDVAAMGPEWYNCDGDTVPFTLGNLCTYIPQTTANADLSWDIFVEYDVEFSEPVSGATVTALREKNRRLSEVQDIEDMPKQLEKLRKKLDSLRQDRLTSFPNPA